MRSIADIDRFKQGLTNTKNETAVAGLPPGYLVGFKMYVDADGRLAIREGVINIQGTRVDHTVEYVLDGTDFEESPAIYKNLTHYLYISNGKVWKADIIDGVWDPNYMGYYHPSRKNYRLIGRFFFNTDNSITAVVSQDPITNTGIETGTITAQNIAAGTLTATEMNTSTLNALFLRADQVIIGYDGSGTYASPVIGDTMLYLDGNKIAFAEYIITGWSTVGKPVIGSLLGGILLTLIGCSGLYHPDEPPASNEFLPATECRIYNFENNYQDHAGVDDWATKTDLAFSSAQKKFGSVSLHDDGSVATTSKLISTAVAVRGGSQSFGAWIYVETLLDAEQLEVFRIDWAESYYLSIFLEGFSGTSYTASMYVQAGADLRLATTADSGDVGAWKYLFGIYNATTGYVYVSIGGDYVYTDLRGGLTWGAGAAAAVTVTTAKYSGGAFKGRLYLDELFFAPNVAVQAEKLSQHYTHGVAWTTSFLSEDQTITPKTGGKVLLNSKTTVNGALTLLGNLSMAAYDITADDIACDQVSAAGAGGLSLKDDSGTVGVFVEDGGQVGIGGNVAPAYALDVTGAIKKTLGTIAAYSYQTNAVKTQNAVFDLFSPFVPNTNDEANITGIAFRSVDGKAQICTTLKRTSPTVITIYGACTDGTQSNIPCTDGTATNAFSGTASLSL
jgi:hypothetical protein